MDRWLIQLQGEAMDLEELPKWFPSGDVYAVEENGNVLLVGAGLNSLPEADAVLKKAQEALDEFSAVVSLLWTSFRKPQIGQVFREDSAGNRSAYIFLTGVAAGRSKAGGVMVDASGTAPAPATTQAQDLLAAARKSKHLQEALKVWADPVRTWGRLYRVMEEVKKHFGKPVDKVGLCTDDELGRFTHTANTAEAAGLDARHASGSFQRPTSPMTLQEATSFVSRLLESALRK
jgi:hypothetical protein